MKRIITIFSIIIAFILIIDVCVYLHVEKDNFDRQKFSKEYNISDNNIFSYKSSKQIYNILKNKTGIILFGKKNNEWITKYSEILNEVALEKDIKEIYFLDITNQKEKNMDKIISLMGNNLISDKSGDKVLYTPNLVVVIDGIIVGNNNLTSLEKGNPADYWTEKRIKNFKESITRLLKPIYEETCITCR